MMLAIRDGLVSDRAAYNRRPVLVVVYAARTLALISVAVAAVAVMIVLVNRPDAFVRPQDRSVRPVIADEDELLVNAIADLGSLFGVRHGPEFAARRMRKNVLELDLDVSMTPDAAAKRARGSSRG